MTSPRLLALAVACALLMLASPAAWPQTTLKMSTTTSTENSGLLSALLPPFEKQENAKVHVIPVGTGKALKLGENGDVDVVFVHSRPAEDKFVEQGFGIDRRDVMYNDFVIVGPKEDSAGLKHTRTAVEAFKTLAEKRVPFVSRGDDSGTHKKEKAIWNKAGVTPSGDWYLEAGQGMAAVLQMAVQKKAYCLTDRGTFLRLEQKIPLVIVFEGDKELYNPYGVIAVNPAKHPGVNYELAKKFIDFVTGTQGQELIGSYRINGKQLFFPCARK
ncbi:MAG: substrate-binding domain-containing protein [Desulfomonilaceae bacterium]